MKPFKKKQKKLLKNQTDAWLSNAIKWSDRLTYLCVGFAYLLIIPIAIEIFTSTNYIQTQINLATTVGAVALVLVAASLVFTINQRYESEKRMRELFTSVSQQQTKSEESK